MRKDIEAGRAHVSLFVKNSEFMRGLNQASAKLKSFGANIAKLGAGMAAAGAGILASLGVAVKHFTGLGDAIDKMAARTGLAASAVAELTHVADQSGASIGTVENAIRRMQRTVGAAADGSTAAADALDKLGFSAERLLAMSPDEQFTSLTDALAGIEDPTLRSAAAMEVFGRSGTALLPMAGQVRALREEARLLGFSFRKEDVSNAAALTDAFARLHKIVSAAVFEIGAALAPTLLDISAKVQNIALAVANWIRENRALVVGVAKLSVGLVAAGGIITAVGIGIYGIGAAVGTVAPLVTAAGAAMSAALSPVTLITAGIVAALAGIAFWATAITALYAGTAAALAAFFVNFTKSGKMAFDEFGKIVRSTFNEVSAIIGGITKALLTGQFSIAGRLAFLGLKLAAIESIIAIQDAFRGLIVNLNTFWSKGLNGLLDNWGNFGKAIRRDWLKFGEAFNAMKEGAFFKAQELLSGIGSGGKIEFDAAEFAKGLLDPSELKRLAKLTRAELKVELAKLSGGAGEDKPEAPVTKPAIGGGGGGEDPRSAPVRAPLVEVIERIIAREDAMPKMEGAGRSMRTVGTFSATEAALGFGKSLETDKIVRPLEALLREGTATRKAAERALARIDALGRIE